MTTLIGSLLKQNSPNMDKIIANAMLTGDKSAAVTYLNAILDSSTPEVVTLLERHLDQILDGHSSLKSTMISNKWNTPYEPLDNQLMQTVKESRAIVGKERN